MSFQQIGFLKECGAKLTDVSPRGIHGRYLVIIIIIIITTVHIIINIINNKQEAVTTACTWGFNIFVKFCCRQSKLLQSSSDIMIFSALHCG